MYLNVMKKHICGFLSVIYVCIQLEHKRNAGDVKQCKMATEMLFSRVVHAKKLLPLDHRKIKSPSPMIAVIVTLNYHYS